jgi:hypothetical protein
MDFGLAVINRVGKLKRDGFFSPPLKILPVLFITSNLQANNERKGVKMNLNELQEYCMDYGFYAEWIKFVMER